MKKPTSTITKFHEAMSNAKKEKPWWNHVYMISSKVSLFYSAKHVSEMQRSEIELHCSWNDLRMSLFYWDKLLGTILSSLLLYNISAVSKNKKDILRPHLIAVFAIWWPWISFLFFEVWQDRLHRL